MFLAGANLGAVKDSEIIELFGGPTALARFLGIKPPSVHRWIEGGIPELRLIELAAEIERRSNGRFSRRERFPGRFQQIWPELATAGEGSHA